MPAHLPASAGPRGMPKLEVLYLYDNRIETIEGLAALPSLTHLYLQVITCGSLGMICTLGMQMLCSVVVRLSVARECREE